MPRCPVDPGTRSSGPDPVEDVAVYRGDHEVEPLGTCSVMMVKGKGWLNGECPEVGRGWHRVQKRELTWALARETSQPCVRWLVGSFGAYRARAHTCTAAYRGPPRLSLVFSHEQNFFLRQWNYFEPQTQPFLMSGYIDKRIGCGLFKIRCIWKRLLKKWPWDQPVCLLPATIDETRSPSFSVGSMAS